MLSFSKLVDEITDKLKSFSAFLRTHLTARPATTRLWASIAARDVLLRGWPVALLAVLALTLPASWLLSRSVDKVTSAPPTSSRPASTVQPKLGIANAGETIRYTGVVADESTRGSVLTALKHAFRDGEVRGRIIVDPNAGPAAWLDQLERALESFRVPGIQALLQGDSIRIGGLLAEADLDGMKVLLQSIFGPGFTVGTLADDGSPRFRMAKEKRPAALGSLKPGFTAADLVAVLNVSTIKFGTTGAVILPESKDLLSKAAALMKTLPADTVFEIDVPADDSDPTTKKPVREQQAEAVRLMLIDLGVPADRLKLKARGATGLLASAGTAESRLDTRRLVFSVVERESLPRLVCCVAARSP